MDQLKLIKIKERLSAAGSVWHSPEREAARIVLLTDIPDLLNDIERLESEVADRAYLNEMLASTRNCLKRIREIAYSGGLEYSRPRSIAAIKDYVNLGIKFCDDALLDPTI